MMTSRLVVASLVAAALSATPLMSLTSGSAFARGSGRTLSVQGLTKCPKCGKAVKPTWKFCDKCGAKLSKPAVKPKPKPNNGNGTPTGATPLTGHDGAGAANGPTSLTAIASTTGADVVNSISVSPDGKSVAYGSNQNATTDIYVAETFKSYVDARGTTHTPSPPVQITNSNDAEFSPDFSPDGKRLVYAASTASGDGALRIVTLSTREVTTLYSRHGFLGQPRWSPDGTKIAFVYRESERAPGDIYLIGVDGANVKQVTMEIGDDGTPTWDPKGCHLGFESDRSNLSQIYAFELATSKTTQISHSAIPVRRPSWGANGRIAFQTQALGGPVLQTMNEVGGNVQTVSLNVHIDGAGHFNRSGTVFAIPSAKNGMKEIFAFEWR